MGWVLNQQQKFSEAELALREHLRRSPESPKGHAQLGVTLLNLLRYPSCIRRREVSNILIQIAEDIY